MAQFTRGLYRLTQIPHFYKLIQTGLGATDARRRVVDEVLSPRPGERVLDLGCGPAEILPLLGDVDYLGIDANPNHVAHARERHGRMGRFVHSDVSAIADGMAERFDLVICLGLLHHLDDGQAVAVLSAASRLLTPGGRFIALDPAIIPGQHPIARLLASMDAGRNVRTPDGYRSLAAKAFPRTDVRVREDLLRFPYSHAITRGTLS